MKKRLSKFKTKLLNRIRNFNDVEKSLQEIEKRLNEFSESMNPSAESEVSDKDGKTGDIKTTRNTDGSYNFEIRTEDGWRTPVIPGGQSPIKYIEKPSNVKKPVVKSLEDIITEDLEVGKTTLNKVAFDEKNDKFIMPRPDYDSDWFDMQVNRQYVTGATDGVAPDSSYVYDDYPEEIIGIPALGFQLKSYPSLIQLLYSSYKTTSFEQSFDGKTGDSGTDAIVVITHEGAGQYYSTASTSNLGMGSRIYMTNQEHIVVSTAEEYTHYWGATIAGGSNVSSDHSDWVDVYDADGGTNGNISARLRIWK